MHIQFNCPSCSKSYKVPASKAGGIGRCVCGSRLQVPDAVTPPPFAAPVIVPEAPPIFPKRKSFDRTERLVPLPLVLAISLAVVAINIAGTYLYVSSFQSQAVQENEAAKAAERKHVAEIRAAREELASLIEKHRVEQEKTMQLAEEADAAIAQRDREIAELNARERKILEAQAELVEAEKAVADDWAVRFAQLSPTRKQRLKEIDEKIARGEVPHIGDLRLMEEIGGRAGETAARIREKQGKAEGSDAIFGEKAPPAQLTEEEARQEEILAAYGTANKDEQVRIKRIAAKLQAGEQLIESELRILEGFGPAMARKVAQTRIEQLEERGSPVDPVQPADAED